MCFKNINFHFSVLLSLVNDSKPMHITLPCLPTELLKIPLNSSKGSPCFSNSSKHLLFCNRLPDAQLYWNGKISRTTIYNRYAYDSRRTVQNSISPTYSYRRISNSEGFSSIGMTVLAGSASSSCASSLLKQNSLCTRFLQNTQ